MSYTSKSPGELIRACFSAGDALVWEEFIRRFHHLIAGVVLRTARHWGDASPQILDDLVQETYLKICADNCRLLRDFESRTPDAIYGFLKVVAANVVHDHFKSAHANKRGAGKDCEPIDTIEIAASSARAGSVDVVERQVLLKEIDDYLRTRELGVTGSRDRAIFWLYYRQGLTASAIAALPWIKLTTKGVESTILRLTAAVRKHLIDTRSQHKLEGSEPNSVGFRPTESF